LPELQIKSERQYKREEFVRQTWYDKQLHLEKRNSNMLASKILRSRGIMERVLESTLKKMKKE